MDRNLNAEITDSDTMYWPDDGPEFAKYLFAVCIVSLFFMLFFGVLYGDRIENRVLYFVNLTATITYFSLIFFSIKNGSTYNLGKLIILTLIFNLVFVAAYNYLFFLERGDFLEIGANDSENYHDAARSVSGRDVQHTLYSLKYTPYDDMGFIVYVSLLYRIISSQLIVDFFNIILNLLTTTLIYRIGQMFLSSKGAFLAALIFGVATYTVFYEASGLKETLMVLLIVTSFYYFVTTIEEPGIKSFLLAFLFCFLIGFFRAPIVFFVLLAAATIYATKKSPVKSILAPVIFMIIISIGYYLITFFYEFMPRYIDSPIAISRFMIGKESFANYEDNLVFIAAGLAAFFGPLPTFIPVPGKVALSIIAGSLIFKTLLSVYFMVGLYYAFKRRNHIILGLVCFCILNIFGLLYLLESFEFRLSFPHFPFFILVCIYGFENFQKFSPEQTHIKTFIFLINVALVGVIVAWNLRF